MGVRPKPPWLMHSCPQEGYGGTDCVHWGWARMFQREIREKLAKQMKKEETKAPVL